MAEPKSKEERAATFKRHQDLLLKMAKAFEAGSDPFNHEFLVENKVTADECFKLSDQIGTIIKGFLGSKKDDQILLLAIGAVYGEEGWEMIRDNFQNSLKMGRTLKDLKALSEPKQKEK